MANDKNFSSEKLLLPIFKTLKKIIKINIINRAAPIIPYSLKNSNK